MRIPSILVLLGLLFGYSPFAISAGNGLLQGHPCFAQVENPGEVALMESAPEKFKGWASKYAGTWKLRNGSDMCAAVFISFISDDGRVVRATYSLAPPVRGTYRFGGGMAGNISDLDGKQVLRLQQTHWNVEFTLAPDGTLSGRLNPHGNVGTFFPIAVQSP